MKARMAVSKLDDSRAVVYGDTSLENGQSVHLAGVYDGTAVRIYVNGSEDGSTPFSGSLTRTNQPLLLGRNGIGGDIFKGLIDDLRIYNRPLSSGEIQSLYGPIPPQAPTNLHLLQPN